MERYLTVSEARQRFLRLVDETLEGDQFIVTKRGKPAVALIDFERLQDLRFLAEMWQNRAAMAAMKEGLGDIRAGRVLRVRGQAPRVRDLIKRARARKLV
jgi:prevent-host-death family protein